MNDDKNDKGEKDNPVDSCFKKYLMPIRCKIPPWFPIDLGGKGEPKSPPLCSVRPMTGPVVQVFLFDRKFCDWTCLNCGMKVADELSLKIPKPKDPS